MLPVLIPRIHHRLPRDIRHRYRRYRPGALHRPGGTATTCMSTSIASSSETAISPTRCGQWVWYAVLYRCGTGVIWSGTYGYDEILADEDLEEAKAQVNAEDAVRMWQAGLNPGFSDAERKLLDESLFASPSSF